MPKRISPDTLVPMNDSETNQKTEPTVEEAAPAENEEQDGEATQPVGGDIAGPDLGDGSDATADKGSRTAEAADSSARGSGPRGGAR